ncbi:hypothetical protein KO361_03695 [Candidatus Woesearchaeota archaeon]|nr:hypothetical protein [Candidatus Woesearchaeota archaeon]
MQPEITTIIKILTTGFAILIMAIILNVLANLLKITTWYDLLNNVTKHGISAIKQESILSIFFLFIIYPFLLGLTAYLVLKII